MHGLLVLYVLLRIRCALWGRMWRQAVDGLMAKFTAIGFRNLRQPGRYSGGNGMILDIGKSGRGSWTVQVQVDGMSRDIGLGSLPGLSLG
jgi:hypothetical protein